MKTVTSLLAVLLLSFIGGPALALSMELHDPSIFFPKSFDQDKAALIKAGLTDPKYKFKEGLTSYWEPKFATTLVYNGDTAALNSMISRLSAIKGMEVNVTYSDDLAKETHGFPPAGNWWVVYDHTKPNTLTLRVNRASKEIKPDEIMLPPADK